MSLHRFACADLPPTPWKNGGGSTREIVSWPSGAGLDDFDWRVSIATIASNGPFSTFPRTDRVTMLIDGGGLRLRGADLDRRLDRLHEPFAFSGDLALVCTLLGAATSNLNVMNRRGRIRTEVSTRSAAGSLDGASAGLLLILRGRWEAGEHSLTEGEGVWWVDERFGRALTPTTPAALLACVHCWPADQDLETAP